MVSPYGYIVCRWSYVTCIPSNRIQTILSISSQFISLSRTISIHIRVARPLERYPTSFLPFSDRVTQLNYVRACLHLKLLRATTRRSKRYQPICAPPLRCSSTATSLRYASAYKFRDARSPRSAQWSHVVTIRVSAIATLAGDRQVDARSLAQGCSDASTHLQVIQSWSFVTTKLDSPPTADWHP